MKVLTQQQYKDLLILVFQAAGCNEKNKQLCFQFVAVSLQNNGFDPIYKEKLHMDLRITEIQQHEQNRDKTAIKLLNPYIQNINLIDDLKEELKEQLGCKEFNLFNNALFDLMIKPYFT